VNRRAHDADPEAQLFYNDHEIEAGKGNPKSGGAYRLVRRGGGWVWKMALRLS
jgi:GH35 family endo-1,4-beta-xylanase